MVALYSPSPRQLSTNLSPTCNGVYQAGMRMLSRAAARQWISILRTGRSTACVACAPFPAGSGPGNSRGTVYGCRGCMAQQLQVPPKGPAGQCLRVGKPVNAATPAGRQPPPANLHERLDGTVLGHSNGQAQRLKGGLSHPGSHHGRLGVVVGGGDCTEGRDGGVAFVRGKSVTRRGGGEGGGGCGTPVTQRASVQASDEQVSEQSSGRAVAPAGAPPTDVQAARHAGQRLGHVGAHGRLLLGDCLLDGQRLRQVSARLLKELQARVGDGVGGQEQSLGDVGDGCLACGERRAQL